MYFYTLTEQYNDTCVSRATSGRLRLNDETRITKLCVASYTFTIHSLLPNRSFSFAEASAWRYVLLYVCGGYRLIGVAFASSMVPLFFSFSVLCVGFAKYTLYRKNPSSSMRRTHLSCYFSQSNAQESANLELNIHPANTVYFLNDFIRC